MAFIRTYSTGTCLDLSDFATSEPRGTVVAHKCQSLSSRGCEEKARSFLELLFRESLDVSTVQKGGKDYLGMLKLPALKSRQCHVSEAQGR